MNPARTIAANVEGIRERMDAAAARANRNPESIRLIGVTKYVEPEMAQWLHEAGVDDLGESRPQELVRKHETLQDATIRWHLIGKLQRNKARRLLPFVHCIQSADRWKLLQTLNTMAVELELPRVRVLLEVNISGDEAKHGFDAQSLGEAVERLPELERIEAAGLMTMAGRTANEDEIRSQFQQLRNLRDDLADESLPLPELSMGMSGDFEIAIEEGATMVRVGRALFEGATA